MRALAVMTDIARSVGGETDIDRILELIVNRGRALVEARALLILLAEGDGLVVAATRDHSKVQQMIDAGEITPDAAARHPDRNKIYSCLGGVVPPMIDTGYGRVSLASL